MYTYSEDFGILKNVTSTGHSLVLCIAYMDQEEVPHFFELEFGKYGYETEEDRRLYLELFDIELREDEAEDLCAGEIYAGVAGDVAAYEFEEGAYNDKVLYFTGQPDQRGAYSIEQIHAARNNFNSGLVSQILAKLATL